MKIPDNMRHLSSFSAWAVAFGCAVGWDAVVMPWTSFLPKAGPIGSLLGLIAGGLVMTVIAWNFHYMINHRPGPGGVYAYATEAFGHDHGYLCAWFLCLTYASIVWLDTAALLLVVRYMMGDGFLRVGFHYTVAGFEVGLGDILVAGVAACIIIAVCVRRRVATAVQTVLAVLFAAAFVVCFVAAAVRHEGGMRTMYPLFSPIADGGAFVQWLNVLMMAPWLFIGFEAISAMTIEFRFPGRRSFGIMVAVIVSAVFVYAILTAIPVLASGGSASGWGGAIAGIGDPNVHAFDVAKAALGKAGGAVVCCGLFGAIFTNLIGNTIVVSRLVAAMAQDGAMPAWLGEWNGEISARNPMIVIACIAVVTSALGQTVIGVIVDVALIGAAIAYAYTSAATLKIARRKGDRLSVVTGLVGLVLSVVIGLFFLLPVFSSKVAMMSTGSYLVLVLWSIAGLALFIFVFRRDSLRRFGRSPVVWTVLFVLIFALSLIWVRQTAGDTTQAAYDAVASFHSDKCLATAKDGGVQTLEIEDWHDALRRNLSGVSATIIRNSYVQGAINVLALALIACFYSILRRRERDMEQEKTRAKSYFFSTVSHDIRTPLNAIVGFAEMLNAGMKTDAERTQATNAILVSSKTLLALVNDVLDLSKLESGKMEISPEPTDCPRLLREIVDAFRVSKTKPGIELRCRVGEMPILMIDPQRLRQILFNFVGNAMKFTERGHVEVRASFDGLKSPQGTGVFRLEVEDTGCGISDEDIRRIGSAYVQVGAKVSRNGGTGLGLAICKQLLASMGGTLEIQSRLGQGSTFAAVISDVKIVAGVPSDDGGRGVAYEPRETKIAPASGVQQPKMPRRLLLVDDSKMNLMVLKALLKHMGDFDVVTAYDGQDALDILAAPGAVQFDVVLTDIWMPRLDGAGLVKAIRANPALSSIRIVAVTADVEFQSNYQEMGCDGILLKPVTTNSLARMLAEVSR